MNMPERPAPDPAGLQSPERLAASYEQVGAGIVEVDGEGRILHLNRQLCQLTGYSPPELLGRTVFRRRCQRMLIAISRNSGVSFQVRSTDTPSKSAFVAKTAHIFGLKSLHRASETARAGSSTPFAFSTT